MEWEKLLTRIFLMRQKVVGFVQVYERGQQPLRNMIVAMRGTIEVIMYDVSVCAYFEPVAEVAEQ